MKEAMQALLMAEEFLESLALRDIDRVPREVCERANQILTHYPSRKFLEDSILIRRCGD